MKQEIRVNKQAQKMLHEEEVQKVIREAITFANAGHHFFYHTKPIGIGLSSRDLIEMVEKETNETVYGGYKCVSGNEIKFSIRY
jgi:hypothetical protein